MTVREVMTTAVASCRRDDDLARATRIMLEHHCGIVPAIDTSGRVVGVITDRDIAFASVMRQVAPGTLRVGDVMARPVHACLPDDSIDAALGMMRRFRVRRLPVIDADGHLKGILSLDDIVLAFHASKEAPVAELFETLAAICAHRHAEVLAT